MDFRPLSKPEFRNHPPLCDSCQASEKECDDAVECSRNQLLMGPDTVTWFGSSGNSAGSLISMKQQKQSTGVGWGGFFVDVVF